MSELEDHLRSLAEPVLARHGADVVAVEVKRGRTQVVRVIADQPDGIDLETCARISRELSLILDVEDPLEGRYTLEVTSPGLDRPLRSPEDFRRVIGQTVRVVLADAQHEGPLEAVTEDAIVLGDGARVPIGAIRRAKLVLPW